ncbi:MAG TPA: lysylphosphatidylglycerol synthase domain-containing protein [Patescibacteria group bacterium]|nr:lysylphosphatidylglycerol synthase domain-containing protein [Patescibacteria group bacterium]
MNEDGGKSQILARSLKSALVLIGFVLFCYLILHMGIGTIIAQLSRFGWWFSAVCVLGASWLLLQTLAWRTMQREQFKGVAIVYLFNVKFISDALNTLLPSANLGGETARLYFTSRFLSRKEALAGVIADKTFEYAAGIPFMVLGFLVAWLGGFFPKPLILPAVLCLVISLAGIVIFASFQLKGMHPVLAAVSRFMPPLRRWIGERERQIRALGVQLLRLYRVPPSRTLLAWGFHFLARLTGVLETILVMHVLGSPVDLLRALFITAMIAGVNTVFFLMPGQWGVAEGSHLFILQSMGYPPLVGLSLGIIKRMRKLAFAACGLLLYSWYRRAGGAARLDKSHG